MYIYCIYIHIWKNVYGFIIRTWLTWWYGGWEVPRSAVGKLETQESWWHGSHSSSLKARDPRRAHVSVQVQRQEKTNVPAQQSHRGSSLLLSRSIQVFNGSDEVAHIRQDNLLYSVYKWNVHLIQKRAHRPTKVMFDQMSGRLVAQSSLAHKINQRTETFLGLLCPCSQVRRGRIFEVMSPRPTWFPYYFYRNYLIHIDENI